MWGVYVRHDGKLHRVNEFSTQNLARWWAIAWLRAGWIPMKNNVGSDERIVPASSITEIILRNDTENV